MNRLQSIANKALLRNCGFINGEFSRGLGKTNKNFNVINPANGSVIAELPAMDANDVNEGAEYAAQAWKTWKNSAVSERSRVLKKMADLMVSYKNDLAAILTAEAGKPFKESIIEIQYAASFFEYYSEEAKRIGGEILPSPMSGKKFFVLKQSVGPAALITPWNFPAAMITRKVGPALAAGCTVLIKPAAQTPLSALAICAIAQEAGVPPGVINCVTVDGGEVEGVGKAMCNSDIFRKVSFTGSTGVGKWLMRESASTVKKVSLELGGNAPFLVFDDADLEVAKNALFATKFRNAGQTCISSNRILVQEKVYDQFASIVSEAVGRWKCGDGFDPTTTLGPLIDEKGLAKMVDHVKDCSDKGASILAGGSPVQDLNAAGGFFHHPTVVTGMTKEMLPYHTETFGPLVPMMQFSTEEEGIALANDTPFGLGGYACTKDLGRAWRVAESIETGMLGINDGAISYSNTPFGGVKESGLGREGGKYGLDEYLETKFVNMSF